MATLLNTLLASLFPALLDAPQENPQTALMPEPVEITVMLEPDSSCALKVYFYQSV